MHADERRPTAVSYSNTRGISPRFYKSEFRQLRPVRRHAAIKSARPAPAPPCWLDSDEGNVVLPSALTFPPLGLVISSESDPSNGATKPAAGFGCSSVTGRKAFAASPCSATLCLVRRGLRAAYLSSSACTSGVGVYSFAPALKARRGCAMRARLVALGFQLAASRCWGYTQSLAELGLAVLGLAESPAALNLSLPQEPLL